MSEPTTTTAEPPSPGTTTGPAPAESAAGHPRRWAALAVIAVAQLMLLLDTSIMNIALPSAARDLGISDADRQWAITAYTLAFGGLLLLGGRVADYVGRKRTLVVALVGFAATSALGGAATSGGMLFAARALQGAFGALLAPAALSLITVMFTSSRERARAFSVFGAVSGAGGAIGLLAGGALTEYLDWRWCLYVNAPIAVVAAVLAVRLVPESRAHGSTRLDVPGAVLVTGGLVALVYAFTQAAKQTTGADGLPSTVGWGDPTVVTLLAVAAAALIGFVVLETRVKNPLLPIRVVLDRNRGGSYLVFLLIGAGLFAMFLFMTLDFQLVLGWTPLRAGFAFLPFALAVIASAGLVARLLPRVGPRPLLVTGLAMASAGMFLLTRTTPDSSYATTVLPSALIIGTGLAMVFVPASSTALLGVREHDAGVASAVLNTAQQVGGSLGVALLNTVAISAVTAKLTDLVASGGDPGRRRCRRPPRCTATTSPMRGAAGSSPQRWSWLSSS
ncbi:MFS transporter [Luteimicrobium album]|uniref:MFS transporter n=1 Tax=Luteimicrobium album TaxID=1054550 RepID=A0ABQ6I3K4_9MICO|nr:MFS transporter [Luteimicrobium album]GMA25197.1 MFS transporter [Luteimicrobium album]